jgi:dienelactone hydrolase
VCSDAPLHGTDDHELRRRLSAFVGFQTPSDPAPVLTVIAERRRTGYTEGLVSYRSEDESVPALLLSPEHPCGGGVVVHHQHHSQWHLGKSEVAGLQGDRWQAFGPALARRGVTVLAPDAVGFEDRRPGGPGTDSRPSDCRDYFNLMCYQLVRGSVLMSTVLTDAGAAHSVLAERANIDPTRVGVLGHSMGGATALFHAALDARICFAAVSGAACTYRDRMERSTGIEATQVLPGVLDLCDLDDIAGLIAPRPLLLCSATEDEYSHDAPAIADAAAMAYRAAEAPDGLAHMRFQGAHSLTEERLDALVDWVANRAGV